MATALKIGDVARRSGVSVDTVRFYERRGVLPAPVRRASGYRQYTEATIERIRFARSLQGLGFTLDEVADVLRRVDAGIASCEGEQPRFEAVLDRIDARINELRTIRADLAATLRRCRAGRCTILEQMPPPAKRSVPPKPRRNGRGVGARGDRS